MQSEIVIDKTLNNLFKIDNLNNNNIEKCETYYFINYFIDDKIENNSTGCYKNDFNINFNYYKTKNILIINYLTNNANHNNNIKVIIDYYKNSGTTDEQQKAIHMEQIITNLDTYIILMVSTIKQNDINIKDLTVKLFTRTLTGKVTTNTCCIEGGNVVPDKYYDNILTSENCVSVNKVQKAKHNKAIHLPVVGEIYLKYTETQIQTQTLPEIMYKMIQQNEKISALKYTSDTTGIASNYIGFKNPGAMCYQNVIIQLLRTIGGFIEFTNINTSALTTNITGECTEQNNKKGINIIKSFKKINDAIQTKKALANNDNIIELKDVKIPETTGKDVYHILEENAFVHRDDYNQPDNLPQQDATEFLQGILGNISCLKNNVNVKKFIDKLEFIQEEYYMYNNNPSEKQKVIYTKLEIPIFEQNKSMKELLDKYSVDDNQNNEIPYSFLKYTNSEDKLNSNIEFIRLTKEIKTLNHNKPLKYQENLIKLKKELETIKEIYFYKPESKNIDITIPDELEYIIICLKRFNSDNTKIKHKITEYKKISINNTDFQIKAVSLHLGSDSKSGHYTTFIYENGEEKLQCNDDVVLFKDTDIALWNQNFSRLETEGYIFLYEKVDKSALALASADSTAGGSLQHNNFTKKTKSKKYKKNTKSKQRKSNQKKHINHKKTKKRIN